LPRLLSRGQFKCLEALAASAPDVQISAEADILFISPRLKSRGYFVHINKKHQLEMRHKTNFEKC